MQTEIDDTDSVLLTGFNRLLLNRTLKNAFSKFSTQFPAGPLGSYILFVTLLGALALGYALTNAPLAQPMLLGTLWLMCAALEWVPIKLHDTPLKGSSLSVSAAVTFAALLILGPAAAILVNTGSALTYCLKEQRPYYKRVLTAAALLCSAAFAGLAFVLAGGLSPVQIHVSSFQAVMLAAAVYFLTNTALISAAVSLATASSFRTVLGSWQWLFLEMLTTLGIGLVMALVYTTPLGILGFFLTSTLLVLPWYSTYFYVQKSRQIAEQTKQIQKANAELQSTNSALDLRVASLQALHNIGLSLNSAQSLSSIFGQILESVQALIGADASAIYLYDPVHESATVAAHIGLSHEYLGHSEMALDGAGIRALRECRLLVMDPGSPVPAMLSQAAVREGIESAACLSLNVAGQVVGGLDICFKRAHIFSGEELDLLQTLAEQAAVAIQHTRLTEKIHESYLSTIRALAATVEAKDPYTRGHSEVVRNLAVATGKELRLSQKQIEQLNLGALFHDIGKIGISEQILNKPGALTEQEWIIMRQHPLIGEQILGQVPALADVARIVLHHHERFDGSGYPSAIGAEQDILAAIVSVCDSYQAMTSDRPYRKAFTHEHALDQIRQGTGTQFVPQIVDAFYRALETRQVEQDYSYLFEPKQVGQAKSRSVEKDFLQSGIFAAGDRSPVA